MRNYVKKIFLNMQDAFLKQEIITGNENTLLAVSGGVDSVAMVHLYLESGCSISIGHCNFQLRGKESDKDEEFVKELANSLKIPFYVKKFDTSEFAEARGISIQMAARELRYQWFNDLLKNEGFQKVALAHHKDDQLETILFNLTKGTGISGLIGMQSQKGNFVRPMLFADREMIEKYAESRDLKWREDSSNVSLKYSRNLIRHKVIPILKEINPSILDTLDYTLLRLVETESALSKSLLSFVEKAIRKKGEDIYISKATLESSVFPTLALHSITSPFGFNYAQCVNVIDSIDHTGKVFYASNSVLNVDRTELILSPLSDEDFHSLVFEIGPEDQEVDLDVGSLNMSVISSEGLKILYSKDFAFLDYDKLVFPLKVRHWASGDWFIPLGMNGKKKISDLMIDEKIPLNLKERVLVLDSGGDIAWVLGLRIDDRYKITENTSRVWKAEYEKA